MVDVSGEEEADMTLSSSHAWSGSILFVIPPMATQPDSNHSPRSVREEKNKKKKGGAFGAWPPAAMQTLQFGRVRSAGNHNRIHSAENPIWISA